jgi:hypothetical protein
MIAKPVTYILEARQSPPTPETGVRLLLEHTSGLVPKVVPL